MTNFNRDGSPLVWTVITLAVLILLAIRLQAHAAQIEIGAGIAHATTQGNGTWYQDGFQHTLTLTQPVVEIGLTGRLTPRMAWHVDAVSLGRYSVNSEDVLPDANYSPTAPTAQRAASVAMGNGWPLGVYQFGTSSRHVS